MIFLTQLLPSSAHPFRRELHATPLPSDSGVKTAAVPRLFWRRHSAHTPVDHGHDE